jgi:hypothetical protein
MKEKFSVIWIVQDEKCPGFERIKNRFNTVTHQHEKP